MSKREDFMALIRAGKMAEARTLLEREKSQSKFEPDSVVSEKGCEALFYKGRRRVEQDLKGEWRLVPKKT